MSLVDTLTNPANLIAVTAATLGVAALWTVLSPYLDDDRLYGRFRQISGEKDKLREEHFKNLQASDKENDSVGDFIREFVDRYSLKNVLATPSLRDKLAQAGLRGERPTYFYYFFRLVIPAAMFFFGSFFFLTLNTFDLKFIQNVGLTAAFVLFGYYLPSIWVKNLASKRQFSISSAFPDGLDLLLICVESGMSIEQSFKKVAEEVALSSTELSEEMRLTNAELSYLPNRRQAYENLARRNSDQGVRSVTTALIQAERYGTPLGDALRTMAEENRALRVARAEKKAAALPAKLTVPMVLFFLPVLVIVIVTPAAIKINRTL